MLELAVGKIVRGADMNTARRIVAASDTRLDVAGAWAVMQVEQYTRMVGHAGLGLIAARRQVPPEVLVPVFQRMVDEGFLSREGSYFSHTPAGEREVATITDSWAAWLNEQLEKDRGRPRSAELRAAADVIAKRLMAEDLANGLPAIREKAFASNPA